MPLNFSQTEAKAVIAKAVEECRGTWILSLREMQEVLISCAGDLAAMDFDPAKTMKFYVENELYLSDDVRKKKHQRLKNT